MNTYELSKKFIESIIGVPVTLYDGNQKILSAFEDTYCFSIDIQQPLTAAYLENFCRPDREDYMYELTESLGTCILLFHIPQGWVILGPYVTDTWSELQTKKQLVRLSLPATQLFSYKIYRSHFVLADTDMLYRSALLLLEAADPDAAIPEFKRISKEYSAPLYIRDTVSADYEKIVLQRYETEQKFVDAVAAGNIGDSLASLRRLNAMTRNLSFASKEHHSTIAGSAIPRTLARKAAQGAGLSPFTLDNICQSYAQKMNFTTNTDDLNKLMEEMIAVLCQEIRDRNKNCYSTHISKAIDYIQQNMNASLSSEHISTKIGVTAPYLARLFKKETGYTISQYLMKVRMQRAAELLAETNLSVQDISAHVGYLDNNYFVKIFKAVFCVTPSTYRKEHRF